MPPILVAVIGIYFLFDKTEGEDTRMFKIVAFAHMCIGVILEMYK